MAILSTDTYCYRRSWQSDNGTAINAGPASCTATIVDRRITIGIIRKATERNVTYSD